MDNLFSVINVARLEECYRGNCGEIHVLMLVVPLAEGNAEQHSEVTWSALIQEACKVPNDHLFQVITNPVSEMPLGSSHKHLITCWNINCNVSLLTGHCACLLLPHDKFCCCLACNSIHPVCLFDCLLFNDLFNLMHCLQNFEVSQKGEDITYILNTQRQCSILSKEARLCVWTIKYNSRLDPALVQGV